ncbi:isoleucine--tRNA ligase [Peribacillus kribbensis]|uniref:isoleucine--tRNA ligase n=1 Tax=Peribacillus kribbensis TaxID=356658 RepID=UPI003CCBB1ED
MNRKEKEANILGYWEKENIFQKSVSQRENADTFVFYEGPPTANGMPHVGHALGRTMKDIMARYQTMQGNQVIRKAGWDTHGLPVELGVEKALGISGKQEIEEYGVEKFIEKCKESVFAYEKEWREFTKDLGYWVDMDQPYMTMDQTYIESVWHILGTLHDKGLLYKGHRVSPYCPSCQTSLSSHEVAQGYKDVKDLSATVKFKLKNSANEYVLGWTTTPWTLPANVALAVNRSMDYVKVECGDEIYIAAASRLESIMKEPFTVLETVKGKDLEGLHYEPPFHFVDVPKGHVIVSGGFVTDDSGTGIVHIAPAYGEDDYKLVQENGLSFVHVVDEKGRYMDEVTPLAGRPVKSCDVDIVKLLHEKGLLFHKEKYEHSYPHCWRCDTPLLYYASDSWFIRTTAMKEQLLSENQKVSWHPDHLRDGRFGNFLENLVDWNISRNRFWGTPLNIWICTSCSHEESPKSREELFKLADRESSELELHKPYVDEVTFSCPSCQGTMKRTPEVIDVWFDSGSMPFAQYHTPFENAALFRKQFPADLVVEGIDQTRGWFYSLLAVSVLYTGKAPYKNVMATGHVLDENGQKMSKSKGNALDPVELIQTYGADALRWSLTHDSAPWNQKRFSSRNVQEAKSKLVDTLTSLLHFYTLYSRIDSFDPDQHSEGEYTLMDRWILSRLMTSAQRMKKEMDGYQVTNAARIGGELVEEISNWYIRRNRDRFWSEGMQPDKIAAYSTLYQLLVDTSRLLAPFVPFVSEEIYVELTGESVHLSAYPVGNSDFVDEELEKQMRAVLEIVELGRSIRHSRQLKTKQPLAKLIVVSSHDGDKGLSSFEDIIKDELIIKEVEWADSSTGFITYKLKLNFKSAGPRLGKWVNPVKQQLEAADERTVLQFLTDGKLSLLVEGQQVLIREEDLILHKTAALKGFSEASSRNYSVIMDTNPSEELLREGRVRDFIRFIQEYRKKLNLPVEKRVDLYISCSEPFRGLITEHRSLLEQNVLLNHLKFAEMDEMEVLRLADEELRIGIK